jgi:serine/threonine protein kinase/tetratricopeptide (TPR) repeat protein
MAETADYVSISDEVRRQEALDRQSQTMVSTGFLETGEEIAGYRITRRMPIQAGGEAEIYFCEKDGVTSILKYFYNTRPDPDLLEKLGQLVHPHIMKTLASGDHKGKFFTIQEYAQGDTVGTKKADGSFRYLPMSEEKIEDLLPEILEAFKAMHDADIIHRDIKPDNIFFKNADGTHILLGDFGIASVADEEVKSRLTRTAKGTHGFMAPEMLSGKLEHQVNKPGAEQKTWKLLIDKSIDYYALGVTLWMLMTGRDPFTDKKGNNFWEEAVVTETLQGKTCVRLLSSEPKLSAKMQKLVRGLMTFRFNERWGYEQVKAHIAGEDVPVADSAVYDLPPFHIAGEECTSYMDIAEALVRNPEEGKKSIYSGDLAGYLIRVDQDLAEKVLEMSDEFSAKKKEGEGVVAIAYKLSPMLPFPVGGGMEITGAESLVRLLETNPDDIIPWLRDEGRGLYVYLGTKQGYDGIAGKIREIAANVKSDLRLAARISVIFKGGTEDGGMGNTISPFRDGVNDALTLSTLEDLEKLPAHLKDRALIFIERRDGDLPAWLENITGLNLDMWIAKLETQADVLRAWGWWRYFKLFLEGKDLRKNKEFSTGEGNAKRYGLRDPLGREVLPAMWEFVNDWSRGGEYIVKRNNKWGVIRADGSEVFAFEWDSIDRFDEERGLYQMKKGDVYFIAGGGGMPVFQGKERLSIARAPGKPFDVIYDGGNFYNPDTFKRITGKDDKVAVPSVGERNFVWWRREKGLCLADGQGTVLKELPYKDFRMLGSVALVYDGVKAGLVSVDGAKVLIPAEYKRVLYQFHGNDAYLFFKDIQKSEYKLFVANGNAVRELATIILTDTSDYILNAKGIRVFESQNVMIFTTSEEWAEVTSTIHFYGAHDKQLSAISAQYDPVYVDVEIGNCMPRYELIPADIEQLYEYGGTDRIISLMEAAKKAGQTVSSMVQKAASFLWDKQDYSGFVKIAESAAAGKVSLPPAMVKQYAEACGKAGDAVAKTDANTALAWYKKAMQADPQAPAHPAAVAQLYLTQKNWAEGIAWLDKALALGPGTVSFLSNKAFALYQQGKYQEALAGINLAIEKGGPSSSRLNTRAAIYKALGMADKMNADVAASKAAKLAGN